MKPLPVAEAYAEWAPAYDATPNPVLALEVRLLRDRVAFLARGLTVDVGCGTARWARLLSGTPCRYVGIDSSLAMLRQSAGALLAAGDAVRLPVAAGVADLSLCTFVLGYLPDLAAAFGELARITRRGGAVVAADLHPAPGWNRSFPREEGACAIEHLSYSEAEILAASRNAGLRLDDIIEGAFGPSERAVFQAAGREDLYHAARGRSAVWAGIWTRV